MDLLSFLLALILSVFIFLPAGYALARLLDRSRGYSVQARITDLAAQARREAENIIKDSELKAKDELFKKREEFNREMEKARGEIRDQERRLEKREDVLD